MDQGRADDRSALGSLKKAYIGGFFNILTCAYHDCTTPTDNAYNIRHSVKMILRFYDWVHLLRWHARPLNLPSQLFLTPHA